MVCRQFSCDWLLGVKGFGPADSPVASGVLGVRGDNWIISPEKAKIAGLLPKTA